MAGQLAAAVAKEEREGAVAYRLQGWGGVAWRGVAWRGAWSPLLRPPRSYLVQSGVRPRVGRFKKVEVRVSRSAYYTEPSRAEPSRAEPSREAPRAKRKAVATLRADADLSSKFQPGVLVRECKSSPSRGLTC